MFCRFAILDLVEVVPKYSRLAGTITYESVRARKKQPTALAAAKSPLAVGRLFGRLSALPVTASCSRKANCRLCRWYDSRYETNQIRILVSKTDAHFLTNKSMRYFLFSMVETMAQRMPPIGNTTHAMCHRLNTNPQNRNIAVAESIITPPYLSLSLFSAVSAFSLLYF